LHYDKTTFGKDVDEYLTERWLDPTQSVKLGNPSFHYGIEVAWSKSNTNSLALADHEQHGDNKHPKDGGDVPSPISH